MVSAATPVVPVGRRAMPARRARRGQAPRVRPVLRARWGRRAPRAGQALRGPAALADLRVARREGAAPQADPTPASPTRARLSPIRARAIRAPPTRMRRETRAIPARRPPRTRAENEHQR